jgi:isopenicillin-N N-acyltransferase-like protein
VGLQYDWGECTALAVLPEASRDGNTWLAQNWDWIGEQRESLVVLRVTDEAGRQVITLTEAGMLAKIGLNDRGVGVCLNILRSVDDGKKPGLPVHVLLRHLLDCASVDAATATAKSITHGASSNLLMADAGGRAASLELSPRGVAVIAPTNGTLAHTNPYLDPQQAEHAATLSPLATTEQRLGCALRLASKAPKAKLGREDLEALLRDETMGAESVCRRPDPALAPEVRIESVAGVVMDLMRRTMWVAPDVPSRTKFRPVNLVAHMPSD